MKDIFSMWRNTRMVVLTAICAAVYVAVLIPFKILAIIPGFTEVRPGAVVPVVCSLLFGPAAAWGSGFGNIIGDFVGGMFGIGSVFGFLGNFLLGYVPYKLLSTVTRFEPASRNPLEGKNLLKFVPVLLISCAACSAMIGWGVHLMGIPFVAVANIVFWNNFILNCILAPIVLALVYGRVKHMGLLYTDILGIEREGPSESDIVRLALIVLGALGGLAVGNLVSLPKIASAHPALTVPWAVAPFIACMLIPMIAFEMRDCLGVASLASSGAQWAALPSDAASVSVEGVTFSYPASPRFALKDASLKQRPGQFVVIMGATGAGKSTLTRLINGIIPEFARGKMSGRVCVLGQDIEGMLVADVAQRVGMVFQDFESQLFSTNALLEVAFGMENLGMDREEMRQRIADMLRLVGLQGHEDRDPATLSGGEKQRLAIASVLAMRPDILIMDEPTTDLDPQGKREIFKVLSALRSSGATVLLVEHELAAAEMSDRVLVLKDGQVGADVPPMDLLRQPSFMEKMSIRPSEVERLFAALQLGPAKNLSMEETASVLQARGFVPQPENCRTFVQKQARPQVAGSHTMIEVESLTHTYPSGLQALKSVNWRVAEGEFLAIVGANGSGKTTLVKHLNGLLRPTAGRVLLKGQDIAGRTVPSLGREVGYCFQNPDHQIFSNTVREEVAFGPRNFGMSKTELAQNVADAIKTVGLEGREESDPFALTKGERQRVAVASILAARPPVIVLDEPTTGLDYAEQRRMMDLVARLNKEGHTIIIITHSMWVVAEYAPRTVVMTGGEIIADGPTREVFSKADVLARANLLPPRLARLTQKWGFTLFTAKEYLECLNRPEPRTLNPEP